MKKATLNTLIKNLPTTGDKSGFIRQLAGVSAQKYRDAHRCMSNSREDGDLGPDTKMATKHIAEQKYAVSAFVEKYGHMTVEEYLKEYVYE